MQRMETEGSPRKVVKKVPLGTKHPVLVKFRGAEVELCELFWDQATQQGTYRVLNLVAICAQGTKGPPPTSAVWAVLESLDMDKSRQVGGAGRGVLFCYLVFRPQILTYKLPCLQWKLMIGVHGYVPRKPPLTLIGKCSRLGNRVKESPWKISRDPRI